MQASPVRRAVHRVGGLELEGGKWTRCKQAVQNWICSATFYFADGVTFAWIWYFRSRILWPGVTDRVMELLLVH